MELQQALDLVLQELPKGTYDCQLDLFQQTITERKRILTLTKGYALKDGDTVVFNSKTKPRYLIGLRARVLQVNQVSAYVEMLDKDHAGKYGSSSRIRVPFSLIDKAT